MKQIIFSLFFFIADNLWGQSQLLEKRWFIYEQDTLLYLMHTPSDKSMEYPLVIWLHGKGERGNDNQSQFKNGVEALLDSMLFNPNYQGYLLVPQCPTSTTWSYYDKSVPRVKMSEDTPQIQKLLMNLIQKIILHEKIDKQRIYLMGISMGGFGVWDIAMRNPDLFAAIVPMCGGADPRHAIKLKNVSVWAFHGDKDAVVATRFSTEIMNELLSLQSENLDTRYSLLNGVGHNVWINAMKHPDLLRWLFSKRKN